VNVIARFTVEYVEQMAGGVTRIVASRVGDRSCEGTIAIRVVDANARFAKGDEMLVRIESVKP
jgi:hypothetical protein